MRTGTSQKPVASRCSVLRTQAPLRGLGAPRARDWDDDRSRAVVRSKSFAAKLRSAVCAALDTAESKLLLVLQDTADTSYC